MSAGSWPGAQEDHFGAPGVQLEALSENHMTQEYYMISGKEAFARVPLQAH